MLKYITNTLILASFLVLISCHSPGNKGTNGNNSINQTISVDEFEKKLHDTISIQLVDVRTASEYGNGHLQGALNYDISNGDFEKQIPFLDKNKPVLVYCLSGGRSSSAAEMLGENGFREVYNMDGGMMKWNASAKPVITSGEVKSGMSLESFNQKITEAEYVLVDFNATWCKPCKRMAPMLDSLADEKKAILRLVKIDADENQDLMKLKHIDALPVLHLYKNGKLIWEHSGEINRAALLQETKI